MADGGYFKKMDAQKACGRDILWAVGRIAFKFDVVVLWVFRMIWSTFGKNSRKTWWLTTKWPPMKLVGAISYESLVGSHTNLTWRFWWFDYFFLEESIKNKMDDGGHFEKNSHQAPETGGRSPRHAQNPLSGERRKTLSIIHHALYNPPSHHQPYIIHPINWLGRFYRITMSLKRPFVPKSDVEQWFTTTTTGHPKSLWAWYLMNHWFDRIQILCSGSLGISNDLINFWGESIKNKMADEGYFEKIATWKACGRNILWTVGLIAFIFDAVVLQAFLMIWFTFGVAPIAGEVAGHSPKCQTGILSTQPIAGSMPTNPLQHWPNTASKLWVCCILSGSTPSRNVPFTQCWPNVFNAFCPHSPLLVQCRQILYNTDPTLLQNCESAVYLAAAHPAETCHSPNVGPTFSTLARHWNNIRWLSRVCCRITMRVTLCCPRRQKIHYPDNRIHCPNADVILGHRLWRWANIIPTLSL